MFPKDKAWLRPVLLACLIGRTVCATAGVNVLTYHNDNARTGQNTNETILTPANVATTNFGKIFSCAVDGYVYAQPLVVTGVTIPNRGVHDVVYVVTEHDSVYAFDANNNSLENAVPLWQVSFINPTAGITTVPSSDLGCTDLTPEVGITSTPVIDTVSGTIYVEAKSKQVTNNVATYYNRLHALDLATGAEKFGGPVVIQPSVAGIGVGTDGTNIAFISAIEMNRAALLLNNGVVYVGTASHCDLGAFHGWLIGYDAQTLTLSNVFNVTPNGGYGGIWQSCASDADGNIYAATGNGTFDGNPDYGDSFLKLSTTNGLQVTDYFTPYDQSYLSQNDMDLGSGGPMLLPDEAGGSITNQHLMVGAGKEATVYLVNRDSMGHFNSSGDSQIVQSLPPPNTIGKCFDTPAYFNHTIYYIGVSDYLRAFTITNANIVTPPASHSTTIFGFPGATPSISANGTNNAIVWALERPNSTAAAVLHAYNATNVALELYNSSSAGTRDVPSAAVKFAVPTVANGKVYICGQSALTVYGFITPLATPVINPTGGAFTNSVSVTITDASPGTIICYTLDGSTPTTNSTLYTGMFVITNSAGVQARAFQTGTADSGVALATFLNVTSIGGGTGLTGAYFSGQLETFNNPPTLVRTDATVNFDWGTGGAPDPSINGNLFTALWTGAVQPQFNETYHFYTTTDDGVRLWVNGQLIINEWMNQGAIEWNGTVALQAGQKYPFTMEYFQNGGGDSAKLSWSSPSTAKAIIPQSQLYPTYPPGFLPVTSPITNGSFALQMAGLVGKGYVLQATTNLANWVSIQTNPPATNPNVTLPTNLFNFTDPAASNFPSRFYRALQQP
jgi:hypothetical protein